MPGATRRDFLSWSGSTSLLAATGLALPRGPAIVRRRPGRPAAIQSGDPGLDSAVVWARAADEARMVVEWADNPEFRRAQTVRGPTVLDDTDLSGRLLLTGLPQGQTVHYRVRFHSLDGKNTAGPAAIGQLRTASGANRAARILWSGDVAGQGWGIDPARGGMASFAAMAARDPDLFVHCGDSIYADNPIEAERALGDGTTWRNLVTDDVAKVAETLAEFRGRYRYNFLDENVRAFAAQCSTVALWDDHETTNNWYPGEILDDPHYRVRSVDRLAARARRAFLENAPLRQDSTAPDRIYRSVPVAPSVEVFALDMRSYRGANSANDQTQSSPATALLGAAQVRWLVDSVAKSRATWKVIAADMPLGLTIRDGRHFEAVADGQHGAPRGRELEVQQVLAGLRAAGVQNVVWVTADVHYAAAHHYHPDRASWREFEPFWEFVAGPLHAGAFGPAALDRTFGPEVVFQRVPPRQAMGPGEGFQSFGELEFDPESHDLTVTLRDGSGEALYRTTLSPAR